MSTNETNDALRCEWCDEVHYPDNTKPMCAYALFQRLGCDDIDDYASLCLERKDPPAAWERSAELVLMLCRTVVAYEVGARRNQGIINSLESENNRLRALDHTKGDLYPFVAHHIDGRTKIVASVDEWDRLPKQGAFYPNLPDGGWFRTKSARDAVEAVFTISGAELNPRRRGIIT